MRTLVTLSLVILAACGPSRSSMISYAALRADRDARFFAADEMVVMRARDPMGLVLVTYEPSIDEGHVVLNAGIASAGSGGERTHCFDLAPLSPREGWEERLFWREPSGARAPITELERGPEARELAALCRARR